MTFEKNQLGAWDLIRFNNLVNKLKSFQARNYNKINKKLIPYFIATNPVGITWILSPCITIKHCIRLLKVLSGFRILSVLLGYITDLVVWSYVIYMMRRFKFYCNIPLVLWTTKLRTRLVDLYYTIHYTITW